MEYVLDTPVVRAFLDDVQAAISTAASPEAACDAIRPRFAELLADGDWLPDRYRHPAPESGMGGGIGQWLLARAGDGSLSLFSLVVPPGAATPIHDHLAWGLVGLYRGTQDEEIYARRGGALELVERRALRAGDFYALVPPHDDIHRVRTTSPETSVSIHLLTNDTGCVWRHAYDAESGEERPFRSGYVNVTCPFDPQPTLVGERVELRPLRADDFDALYAAAADPLIWEQHPEPDRHREERFRAFFSEHLASGGALVAIDRRDGRVVGTTRFHGHDPARSEVEIGWTFLARSHWGGDFNGEMKRLMLAHASRSVGRVVFLVDPENVRSQRAVERIGAVRAGTRRGNLLYEIVTGV